MQESMNSTIIPIYNEKDKMLHGLPFNPLDPTLNIEQRNAKIACRQFNSILAPYLEEDKVTYQTALQQMLPHADKSLWLEPPFICEYGYQIYIGENVYCNAGCVFLDIGRITIGNNTMIGPGVHLYANSHPLDAIERQKTEYGLPITIGSNVWIGGRVIILGGITIGDRSIIAAGSVVTQDIPNDVIVAGVPAVIKKHLIHPTTSTTTQIPNVDAS